MKRAYTLLILPILLLAACDDNAVQFAQVPTATLAPVVSMTPRFTATPVSTRTPLPSITPTPSDTPIPPTPSNTFTPSPTPPVVGIVASIQRVNVRQGPGASFSIIEVLDPGTGVEVLGQNENGRWLNIRMEDDSEGWISAQLVRLEETITPAPTSTPSPDLTALFLGTPLPTAIIGGGTVTPTPPRSVVTPTPLDSEVTVQVALTEEVTEAVDPQVAAAQALVQTIAANDATATALVGSIAGEPGAPGPTVTGVIVAQAEADSRIPVVDATAIAATLGAARAGITVTPTSSTPVGGPTGGPVGGNAPTPTSPSAVVQADRDVLAYCDDSSFGSPPPRDLAEGSNINVFWSWFARTEDQVRQHIDAANYQVTVNGTQLTDWQAYQAPIRRETDGNYIVYWFVPVGPLEAGEVRIDYAVSWSRDISDGYAQFGPGTSNPSQSGSCTFTVR